MINTDLIFYDSFVKIKKNQTNDITRMLRKYFKEVGFFANFSLLHRKHILIIKNMDYLNPTEYADAKDMFEITFTKEKGDWYFSNALNLIDDQKVEIPSVLFDSLNEYKWLSLEIEEWSAFKLVLVVKGIPFFVDNHFVI